MSLSSEQRESNRLTETSDMSYSGQHNGFSERADGIAVGLIRLGVDLSLMGKKVEKRCRRACFTPGSWGGEMDYLSKYLSLGQELTN